MGARNQIRDLRANQMVLAHAMKHESASGKMNLAHRICMGLRTYVALISAAIRKEAGEANGGGD
ncbi:hypothetical protein [Burkholderia diffusa]|uniref:hypothetical protein n=1 Tax=Burkholderia diffusa TaxID=488732 RepID=UPI002AAFCB94|nr:hypothetical protein [Burkholderia diffusa]